MFTPEAMNPASADYGMAPPIAVIATCTLNQWVLDFEGNKRRILESVKIAKEKGCKYRLGPELEICGYDCEDHFYELDTTKFSWKVLGEILADPICEDILCDFSMPVLHNGVRYNCRIYCLSKSGVDKDGKKNKPKILLIRPKMWMADDGNYREERWFTPWSKDKIEELEDYVLADDIAEITGQKMVKFGVGIVETVDATIASEVCEELFTPESPNIQFGLEGVDIISNGSASHWQMGKRSYRHSLIGGATSRNGGVYLYSNLVGCDGNRLVFDGNSMIYKNGKLLATGDHLTHAEVEVVTASVNLDDVRAYRSAIVSRGIQADRRDKKIPRVMVEDYVPGFRLTCCNTKSYEETRAIILPTFAEEEEMGMGLSRYMWDYLCRSTAGGFFLPLSGGVDSGSTSLFVYYMCNRIVEIVNAPLNEADENYADKLRLWKFVNTSLNNVVLGKFNQRPGYKGFTITEPYKVKQESPKMTTRKLMNILLHTCNMPTNNNTAEIRKQASDLAEGLGCYHLTTPINDAFVAAKNMVKDIQFGTAVEAANVAAEQARMEDRKELKMEIPRYKSSDGDWQENLAIQNIQARLRMVTAYYMAQILPLHRWNQDYGGVSKEDWATYYAAKQAAIEEAKSKPENKDVPEEKLAFSTYFKKGSPEAALHDKIIRTRGGAPFLLVLASSNSDEALRGFFTKYDAGSADLNPIGSFSKTELRKFMKWVMLVKFHGRPEAVTPELIATKEAEITAGLSPELRADPATPQKVKEEAKLQVIIATSVFEPVNRILNVTASPELTPTAPGGAVQDDEVEIEMTYKDLYELGLLRKRDNLGPYSMFLRLCKDRMGKEMEFINLKDPRNKFKEIVLATPTILATIIERFFNWYGKNRSKMTILTPGIHATNYSPDDNRFDQRPYLYPFFPDSYQMKLIRKLAAEMEEKIKSDKKNSIISRSKIASKTRKALLQAEQRDSVPAKQSNLRLSGPLPQANPFNGAKTVKTSWEPGAPPSQPKGGYKTRRKSKY
jgi:NAD+ synthase (glutamine-hydrolysing)